MELHQRFIEDGGDEGLHVYRLIVICGQLAGNIGRNQDDLNRRMA